MIARFRGLARLAWRESRSARRKLFLYMSSIAIGVAALVAIDIARRDPLARLKAYVRLFATTYAQDGRLCVCGMLGAEADALPVDVADVVAGFFQLNLVWLTSAFRDAQRSGQVSSTQQARALAELMLSSLEGAMVVGRGARSGGGPAAIGRSLLRSVTA